MRKIILAVAVGLFMVTPACKKGENDPFFSLKSRKARLAGIYTFTSLESSGETLVEGIFTYRTSTDIKIEEGKGTQVTTIIPEEGGEVSDTKIKNIQVDKGELIIDKDGTWEFTMNISLTWEEEGGGVNDHYEFTEIQTIAEAGNWNFLDGDDRPQFCGRHCPCETYWIGRACGAGGIFALCTGARVSDPNDPPDSVRAFNRSPAKTVCASGRGPHGCGDPVVFCDGPHSHRRGYGDELSVARLCYDWCRANFEGTVATASDGCGHRRLNRGVHYP